MAHVKIETIKNGPYIVTGEVELIDAMETNSLPKNEWLFVAAAHRQRNHFATAHTRRSDFKPLRKRYRNQRNSGCLT